MFIHFYYYVPRCPNCGSWNTGRYVRAQKFGETLNEYDSLRHGEIVTEVDVVPEKNCYCEDCGYEWKKAVYGRFLRTKQYEDQKEKRSIRYRMEQYKNRYFSGGKPPKRSITQRLFF